MVKFCVVGGGIAGLTAAYNLSLNPQANVILLEVRIGQVGLSFSDGWPHHPGVAT